ncbi:MAG: histidine ammonia-lyase [Calditrichia bacterium]
MGSIADERKIKLILDGHNLKLTELVQVARTNGVSIAISKEALGKMDESRRWVEQVQQTGKPVVYGINTGFGSKATVSISKQHLRELQRNLILSHSAGTGDPLPVDVVRAAMLLRANTLCRGYSGIRPVVVQTLLQMLEKNVVPWIPEQGSVGASGDLAPLSHLALVLSRDLNEDSSLLDGKAYYLPPGKDAWQLLSGKEAMMKAGIERLVLEAKEGLALNNGTQISTALLALALYDAKNLVKGADIAMAMSLEALLGISSAFHPEIHRLRPHAGQVLCAENIRKLIENSRLIDSHPRKVQDAYSLRCHPQVLGGVRQTLAYIEKVIDVEMNSTNDNPIILPHLPGDNKAVPGGNFHAQPIAFAADFLSIVLCEIGSIAERRIFRMSDKHLNEGLPSFLVLNSGLESGLMIAQYTAASIVSENKSLAHPASIDSIPTCENQEDHVSMAPIAARKARQILDNVYKIIAIELLFAAQALDLRVRNEGIAQADCNKILGKGTCAAYSLIRNKVSFIEKDRPIYPDIENMIGLLKSGKVVSTVEEKTGILN